MERLSDKGADTDRMYKHDRWSDFDDRGVREVKEEMYLIGVYSMRMYTVGELEMKLAKRFGCGAYEAVCDVVNGLIRVYAPREERG